MKTGDTRRQGEGASESGILEKKSISQRGNSLIGRVHGIVNASSGGGARLCGGQRGGASQRVTGYLYQTGTCCPNKKKKPRPMCHFGTCKVCMGNGALHKRASPLGQCGVQGEGAWLLVDAPMLGGGCVPWQCVPSCP